jgi:hypothetical protein
VLLAAPAGAAGADGTALVVTDAELACEGAGELCPGEDVAAVLPRVEDALEQPRRASAEAKGKIRAAVRDKGIWSPT